MLNFSLIAIEECTFGWWEAREKPDTRGKEKKGQGKKKSKEADIIKQHCGQNMAKDSTAFISWVWFVFRWSWETKLKSAETSICFNWKIPRE